MTAVITSGAGPAVACSPPPRTATAPRPARGYASAEGDQVLDEVTGTIRPVIRL